jgi:hypothetical protein
MSSRQAAWVSNLQRFDWHSIVLSGIFQQWREKEIPTSLSGVWFQCHYGAAALICLERRDCANAMLCVLKNWRRCQTQYLQPGSESLKKRSLCENEVGNVDGGKELDSRQHNPPLCALSLPR